MDLKETFNSWAKMTPKEFARKQWLLSKWEVIDGIDWPKEKIDAMIQSIAEGLKLKSSDTLADLGCGGGWVSQELKKYVKRIYGVDFAQHMFRHAKRKDRKNILVCGEIGNLPFKPETFTSVLSYFVFINMTDDTYARQSILEMIRVLKKGGRALIGQLPDEDRSLDYDNAKNDYLKFCQQRYKFGKSFREQDAPPIKLFNRKLMADVLRGQNIRFEIRDSFNPFYRPGKPRLIHFRFDIVIEKS